MNLLTYLFAIGNIMVTAMMAYNHETSRWCSFWDGCLFALGLSAFFTGEYILCLLFVAPTFMMLFESILIWFKGKRKKKA